MLVGRSGELDANTPRKLLSTELPVVRIHLDDLIVLSDTIEEHASRLEHVLQRFERENLQNVFLQNPKCGIWFT